MALLYLRPPRCFAGQVFLACHTSCYCHLLCSVWTFVNCPTQPHDQFHRVTGMSCFSSKTGAVEKAEQEDTYPSLEGDMPASSAPSALLNTRKNYAREQISFQCAAEAMLSLFLYKTKTIPLQEVTAHSAKVGWPSVMCCTSARADHEGSSLC